MRDEETYQVLDELSSSNKQMDELLAKCIDVMTPEQLSKTGLIETICGKKG